MKTTLTAGTSVRREFGVDRERTIDFMGDRARVYSTPMMVRDIEVACREFLLAHLDPGEDSVGTRVELDHLAPTLLGMTVTVEAKVAEVKGRLIAFEVSVHDGIDQVGRGRHLRYVIEMKAQEQRLAAKAEKAGLRR